MAIDGYADETIEAPGFFETPADIRTDRDGGFAYNHRFGETTDNWKITVLNNRRVAYQVPWKNAAWDMTIGRDGNRWIVAGRNGDLEMYRDGSQVVNDTEAYIEGVSQNDVAVSRSPSVYSDDVKKHNAILPVFAIKPFVDQWDDFFRVHAPHDYPIPENPSEFDEISLYYYDEGYNDNPGNEAKGVYPAGSEGGEYLFLVDRGGEVRLFGVTDSWFGLFDDDGLSEDELVDAIKGTNQASRLAYISVYDNGLMFDYPNDISPHEIQITPVTDGNQNLRDGLIAVLYELGGGAFVVDDGGFTRLTGLSGVLGVGLDPEGRYVAASNGSRGIVWDIESDYEVVLDTDFRPKVDGVRGIQWNDETRELLILWDDDDAEQRYASFFEPPFRQTFDDANRPLREMVTATCVVPDGEFSPGDTVEIAAEFDSESFETVRAEATWTVADIELSADGIIDARGTGRISDRLTIGNVETEETGTELDVQMEWSVSRRDDE